MTSTPPDYKSTVRLPTTDFPMKGNLPVREPEIIKKWLEGGIYQKMLKRNQGRQSFVMPDGPPYANGNIHIGHALNKTLKDIILKYKSMSGFHAPFIPGWDCHGLPIEHAVMKNLGKEAKEKTNQEIRMLCRLEAQKWINTQREQFKRLGVLADWDHPYVTMSADYEAEEVREFARAFEKGVVYLGTKPVYWNWTLQTALADAEVEYHQHRSPSIYVKFPVTDAATRKKISASVSDQAPLSMVIWTTTPWTLPANLGVCLNADFEYGVFETASNEGGKEYVVVAAKLKEAVEKETGLTLTPVSTFKGADLDLGKARHPFYDRDSLIMLGDHVSLEAGTGCVHTAPGHGADDYRVGLKYGLPILSPVGPNGAYTDEVPEYQGVNIFKANPIIIERLKSDHRLLSFKEFEHSYPHCWRSKTPLIFRATPQWFLGLDMEKSQIRQKTLKALDDIKFFPAWGEARLRSMMEGRPDWCLSRQRTWGVPIPIFYCKKTGQPLARLDIMMKVADVMEKEGGIDAYYKHDPEFFIGAFTPQGDFGSEGFRHGQDILDVWFDSGVCHAAVQRKREGMSVPADIYLEGSDQHRGWFNTSLLSSMATNEAPPFKALLTHGFVNDAQGLKMSKSKGNSVEPADVSNKSGAEILRLWCIYEDYGQDLTCGPDLLDRVTETYRRIRNTMRFLLGATNDFDPAKDQVPYEKMTEIDQWALGRLAALTDNVTAAYDEYSFYKVYHALNQFFTVDLSATYLDVLKDRLYTWKADGIERRSSQTVLFLMTDYLVRMMAPVLSFLAEEVYSYAKGPKAESVFLLDFPKAPALWKNKALNDRFDKLLEVRSLAQKQLEELRAQKIIGASLEACVTIKGDDEVINLLKNYQGLREFLIVSEVRLDKGPLSVHAEKAAGEKCVRCWTYSDKIGTDARFPGICPKCVAALA
ncbi:MAG: isoleucine--tRNA ligase [Bdellovibrionaceae bacterium]|nr:isoleucine--tRNA ligase [Pseudobdellovibrionaceae bacterium]